MRELERKGVLSLFSFSRRPTAFSPRRRRTYAFISLTWVFLSSPIHPLLLLLPAFYTHLPPSLKKAGCAILFLTQGRRDPARHPDRARPGPLSLIAASQSPLLDSSLKGTCHKNTYPPSFPLKLTWSTRSSNPDDPNPRLVLVSPPSRLPLSPPFFLNW